MVKIKKSEKPKILPKKENVIFYSSRWMNVNVIDMFSKNENGIYIYSDKKNKILYIGVFDDIVELRKKDFVKRDTKDTFSYELLSIYDVRMKNSVLDHFVKTLKVALLNEKNFSVFRKLNKYSANKFEDKIGFEVIQVK